MALLLLQGLILMGLISFNEAASIYCDARTATVTLTQNDLDKLGQISPNELWYLGDPDVRRHPHDSSCVQQFNVTSLTIPVSSCSGKPGSVAGDDNTISVSWHIRKYTTSVFHRKDACILVRCLFKVDFNETLGITQVLNKYTETATSSVTDITVDIQTFGNESYRDAWGPTQNSFVVPSKVWGKLKITNPNADPTFSIHVDECHITPSVGHAAPRYGIVLGGLPDPIDPSNEYSGGVDPLVATFCFDSFAWVNCTVNTYVIQCTGVACVRDSAGHCAINPFLGGRRRRSTFNEMYFEAASRPLWFIDESAN